MNGDEARTTRAPRYHDATASSRLLFEAAAPTSPARGWHALEVPPFGVEVVDPVDHPVWFAYRAADPAPNDYYRCVLPARAVGGEARDGRLGERPTAVA